MDEKTARERVVQFMTAAIGALEGKGISDTSEIGSRCTESSGAYTGEIQVGLSYKAENIQRDAGLSMIHDVRSRLVAAGLPVVSDGADGDGYASVLFRNDDLGIRAGVSVNTAGGFSLDVISRCVSPNEPDETSNSAQQIARPAAPALDPATHIRSVLG